MAPKKSAAKKKKAAAGAQRGFATVSVPSKKVEAAAVDDAEASNASPASDTALAANSDEPAKAPAKEWSPEEQEIQDLQKLVEAVRPVIEKEVGRIGKVYDYDRRMAANNAFYAWTATDLQRRILDLAQRELEDQPVWAADSSDESKAIIQLATVQGLLLHLGFTKDAVQKALLRIQTVDIEHALDWLFLNCDPEELYSLGVHVAAQESENASGAATPPRAVTNGKSSASPSQPATPAPTAAASVPQAAKPAPAQPASNEDGSQGRVVLDEILAMVKSVITLSEENSEDANGRYAMLKLQQSELQRAVNQRRKRGLGTDAVLDEFAKSLDEQLESITNDYTFRKVDAEQLFRQKRVELDRRQLEDRLNGISLQRDVALQDVERPKREPKSEVPTPAKETASTSDGEDGGLFGHMLNEPTTQTTTDTGAVIHVEDYGLPKSFSGRTPRRALEETLRKLDRNAIIVFTPLSKTPRVCRSRVDIRWKTEHRSYSMDDLATRDQASADNYISTIALFDVADGQVQKTLPPIFRDLWTELAEKKTKLDDAAFRDRIKEWRELLSKRAKEAVPKPLNGRLRDTAVTDNAIAPAMMAILSPDQSKQLAADFAERQSWPSYQDMWKQRAQLPIAAYRMQIVESLEHSQCLVLCGETGCGKSTQVPSFILEHGLIQGKHTKIYCTEPRRISAISLAQRVSQELGEAKGACGGRNSLVGYSIRLDANVSASTRIVYATTGIVLRMLEGSDALSEITHLIIDEVHERSIDSDFLLIVLRQLLKVRLDLKVILMSATVDAEKIAAYMGGCPVITVPGRTYPVSAYFLEDVLQLTGYHLDAKSDSMYVSRQRKNGKRRPAADEEPPSDSDDEDAGRRRSGAVQAALSRQVQTTLDVMDQHVINFDLITSLLETVCFGNSEIVPFSSAILVFLPSLESIRRLNDMLESHPVFGSTSFLILPLHSMLSNENQSLVFDVPPPGVRKIVISTNIAETGVTIPDITCVIDSGKHREMRYDEKRQISRLVETYVAQSNSAQRRGRAGRVQEGVCFHLFTRDRFQNIMAEHPQPEIMRLSLQDLALRIKTMKIGNSSIEDVLSQALDPPLAINIQRAVATLIEAKALTNNEEITPLGRHLAKLPMDVHLGKFLIMSCLFNCLDAALTIVAALNSKSPWVTPFNREAEADAVKRSYKIDNSDFLTLYNAYCAWRDACGRGRDQEFCRKNFLSRQNLQMIEELKQQYFGFLVDTGFVSISDAEKRELMSTKWNGKSRTRFVRVPEELDEHSKDSSLVTCCLAASLYPKLLLLEGGQLFTLQNRVPAAIHPSSVNFGASRRFEFEGSRFLTFFTAMRTKKLYVWESGTVDEKAIYLFCGNADFELHSQSAVVDRKIRATFEPKTAVMLKLLREKFNALFLARMRDPSPSAVSDHDRQWLDLVREALVSEKNKKEEAKPSEKMSLNENEPHPNLREPVLYVDPENDGLTDQVIADALTTECSRFKFERTTTEDGRPVRRIVFERMINAEKAYAAANGLEIDQDNTLKLWCDSNYSDSFGPEDASVIVRLWPREATFGELFLLCRPCGPVASIVIDPELSPQRYYGHDFPPVTVSFYDELDAKLAIKQLHCHNVRTNNIWVAGIRRWRSMLRSSYAPRVPPGAAAPGFGGPNEGGFGGPGVGMGGGGGGFGGGGRGGRGGTPRWNSPSSLAQAGQQSSFGAGPPVSSSTPDTWAAQTDSSATTTTAANGGGGNDEWGAQPAQPAQPSQTNQASSQMDSWGAPTAAPAQQSAPTPSASMTDSWDAAPAPSMPQAQTPSFTQAQPAAPSFTQAHPQQEQQTSAGTGTNDADWSKGWGGASEQPIASTGW